MAELEEYVIDSRPVSPQICVFQGRLGSMVWHAAVRRTARCKLLTRRHVGQRSSIRRVGVVCCIGRSALCAHEGGSELTTLKDP